MMTRVARTVDMERAATMMTSESAPQLAGVGGKWEAKGVDGVERHLHTVTIGEKRGLV